MRGADYTIWLVALLLYIVDAARLLAPRHLLLTEAGPGRLAPVLSDEPFTLAGRALAFTPLLRPDRGAFAAPWGEAWADGARLESAVESLARLRQRLRVARLVAAWAFVLLFGVGPALTLALGTSAAVVYTAAILYPTILVAIGGVWWQRRALGLTAARCAGLGLEILVCPAFLPNLVRKITWPHPIAVDAAQLLVATGSRVDEEFLGRLERRAEDLVDRASPGEAVRRQLDDYLATVRSAR